MVDIIDDYEDVNITIQGGPEDLHTYTELDPENNIVISPAPPVAANRVDWTLADRTVLASVYKDYGPGHFGDFTHKMTHLCSYRQSIWNSIHGIWGLSNGAHSLQDMIGAGGLSLFWWSADDHHNLRFSQYQPLIGDYSIPLSLNTVYYLTIRRIGTTATCEIYNLPERTPASLVDTLTLTGLDTRPYSTILTYHSYNNASWSATSTGYDKDLEFI